MTDSTPDRELLRLHRRACTDFAARMRLPAWEHLPMNLAEPMSGCLLYTSDAADE